MRLDLAVRPRPEITHRMDCSCPSCRPPSPSDPRRALLHRLLHRGPSLFALGMVAGLLAVAATGNLGAALRALFGL
ncbi:hypothetical protein [Sphingomonas sp. TF3]|uniref:hypothetical protein n=1 Tax=unclassified Sphingomonas TaxID=196159 RepID=UPI000F879FC5|nr:hypothetical protein [Sphingomonas sp. TF3]RUN77295.1 hypothetical protein EJC47_07390 [Sphingomonas sp. TF3]